MPEKRVANVYYHHGSYRIALEPGQVHVTEASMLRRAHALGYTHVCTKHGKYTLGMGFAVRAGIPGGTQLIPKKYRGKETSSC
jgi:hypothetical protein